MMLELLAPAKNKEVAIAAINCGADAVYMGAPAFGARKNVPNSLEDIKEVIDYAHKFFARVHITMNTILTDSELNDAIDIIHKLTDIGIDVLIIQDLGLLNRLMEEINAGKKLPLIHMSTQCDNYLPQKVKFFNDIGISRVVLARELSLEQIRKLHEANPNLELESFVHGALCVSFSGQCYLSQYIGGRSANRGECAQPCRKKYTVETIDGEILKKDFYALCLKDFNASNRLNDLIDAGVVSFKIEGRLKEASYVKNIVAYYKEKLEGKSSSSGKSFYSFIPNPEKTFNRGFTEYFLERREDCFNFNSPKSRGEYIGKVVEVKNNSFKLSTKKDLSPQDGLFWGNDGVLINKIDKGWIYPNKQVKIKIGTPIYRNYDFEFEKELSKPIKRQIGVNIEIKNNTLYLKDEDGIEISKLITSKEISKNQEKMNETFEKQITKTGDSCFYVLNYKNNCDVPFMPISEINELRRNAFNELMLKRIDTYNAKQAKQNKLKHTKYFLDEVDYRANVHNKEAKAFYEKCGCNVLELSLETKLPNRSIALMRCKHCIKYALNMCKSPKNLVLRDEKGTTYPLKFDCKNCEMHVLKS